MRLRDIGFFVFRDLFNLRVGWEVVVGVVILAIATAISALSVSFSRSATALAESMLEPVRSVASTVQVTPERGSSIRKFDVAEFRELKRRIEGLKNGGGQVKEKPIRAWSVVVTNIPNGRPHRQPPSLQLLNSNKKQVGTAHKDRIRVWSTPPNSPFLQAEHGMKYLYGGAFSNEPGGNTECLGTGIDAPEAAGAEDGDGFRAKLGVIANASFLAKSNALNENNLSQAIQEAPELRVIWIRVGLDRKYIDTSAGATVDFPLCVSGVVDAPDYDFDLVFTEDLARAWYLVKKGAFYGRYVAWFDQWESDLPLARLDTRGKNPDGLRPRGASDFDYVSLRDCRRPASEDRDADEQNPGGLGPRDADELECNGFEPYNMVILTVADWRSGETRENLRTSLLEIVELPSGVLEGNDAEDLSCWAHTVENVKEEGAQRKARANLSRVLNERLQGEAGFELDHNFSVHGRTPMGSTSQWKRRNEGNENETCQPQTMPRTWKVSDSDNAAFITWSPSAREARLSIEPIWAVKLPAEAPVKAIQRLDGLIESYGSVLLKVVFVFAVGAAGLLSLGHVLRKGRDIGILTAFGASRTTIFSIYIAQIAVMAIAGWLVGIAASRAVGPVLESHAMGALGKFVGTEAGREFLDRLGQESSVLALDAPVFSEAFLWVVPAALLGALLPVFRASVVDPLANLNKGG